MVLGISFKNSPEYDARLKKPYREPSFTIKQVRAAMPKRLMEKHTLYSIGWMIRDWSFAALFFALATQINTFSQFVGNITAGNVHLAQGMDINTGLVAERAVKWTLWGLYFWYQGLVFTGIWILGHEGGHGNLSPTPWINDMLGYILHIPVLSPFFAWKFSHNMHHKTAGSVERDENYCPKNHTHYLQETPISSRWRLTKAFYEAFEDTPVFTAILLFIHQLLGWNAYLLYNAAGREEYPLIGTSHFNPFAKLWKNEQRTAIFVSDVGLAGMIWFLASLGAQYGSGNLIKYYLVPYAVMNHTIVWLTFLHHTDPSIPHFRKSNWTFLKGAAATVDRPFLGWQGRFFLHNISHDHVVHHFFPEIPFYNGEEATEILKTVMGEDYNSDTTSSLYALWRTFSSCEYIDDEGGIVFYKNRKGKSIRELDGDGSNPLMRGVVDEDKKEI